MYTTFFIKRRVGHSQDRFLNCLNSQHRVGIASPPWAVKHVFRTPLIQPIISLTLNLPSTKVERFGVRRAKPTEVALTFQLSGSPILWHRWHSLHPLPALRSLMQYGNFQFPLESAYSGTIFLLFSLYAARLLEPLSHRRGGAPSWRFKRTQGDIT